MQQSIACNHKTYTHAPVVQNYAKKTRLYKPEEVLIERYKDQLCNMAMLDIGIGGGRTTRHFAPRAKTYIGTDYAPAMIEACKQRMPALHEQLHTCDVRDMSRFPDDRFDFILFSFNGLDYIDHDGRLQALREINRVCRLNGLFCFSSHNILSVDSLLKLKLHWNPFKALKSLRRHLKLAKLNAGRTHYTNQPHGTFIDHAHNFGLETYYVNPHEQIRQLETAGFGHIKIYCKYNGAEIPQQALNATCDRSWLFYTCEKIA